MGIDTLFYESRSAWFGWVANLSILFLIASFLVFVGWVIVSHFSAKRRELDEILQLTENIMEEDRKRLIAAQGYEHLQMLSYAQRRANEARDAHTDRLAAKGDGTAPLSAAYATPAKASSTSSSPFAPGTKRAAKHSA